LNNCFYESTNSPHQHFHHNFISRKAALKQKNHSLRKLIITLQKCHPPLAALLRIISHPLQAEELS
jgi:hypothetical protein